MYRQDGTLAEWQHNETTGWTNTQYTITDAVGHIGPITDTDTTAQDAFMKPDEYTVQNGQLVHSNAPTAQQQLDTAKRKRIADLQQQFQTSLLNGFTSSADGTARTYAIDPVAMSKWTGALANINSGKITSVNLKDFSGNRLTLTGSQFQQMTADGFTFYNGQEAHLWHKEDDVNAVLLANYATTQDAINAVNAVSY